MPKKKCATNGCHYTLDGKRKDRGQMECSRCRSGYKPQVVSTSPPSSSSLTTLLLIPSTQTHSPTRTLTQSPLPTHIFQPYTEQKDGTIKREKEGVGGSATVFTPMPKPRLGNSSSTTSPRTLRRRSNGLLEYVSGITVADDSPDPNADIKKQL